MINTTNSILTYLCFIMVALSVCNREAAIIIYQMFIISDSGFSNVSELTLEKLYQTIRNSFIQSRTSAIRIS